MANGLPELRRAALRLPRRCPQPPHARDRLERPKSTTSTGSPSRPPELLHVGPLDSELLTSPRARQHPRYYETDVAAALIDYGVDDPSFLSEQPDDGAQEPDATVDDDYYYSGGAYYY
uniref:Uncharacterized protein n=1 Tax=Triticum urartu TaxID=4572 RepID=A0A8R7V4V5_TRIUA